MSGLIWISAVWIVTCYGVAHVTVRRADRWPLSPLLALCIVLLMLGMNSTVETAAPSVGLHTLFRGLLASAALLFAVRVLLVNGRAGRTGAGRNRTNLILLAIYATVAALSTLYSVDPLQTAGKAYELATAVVVVWAITTSPHAEQQLRASLDLIVILWSTMLLVAVVGFLILPSQFTQVTDVRPGFVFESNMGAPYAHSNSLSSLGAMLTVYAIARAIFSYDQRTRRMWYALSVLGSVAILLASGRQGVIIWAVGVGIVLFLYARPLFVFFLIPLAALLLAEFGATLWEALTRQQQDATLYTLSGRMDFWRAAFEAWQDSPLLGYGYGAGGRFVVLAGIGWGRITSLHSGYFEALVGVGLVGLVPLMTVVWRVARWSFRRLRLAVDSHIAILIVPLVLHTAISLGFAAWLTPQFMALALIAALGDVVAHADSVGSRLPLGTYHP